MPSPVIPPGPVSDGGARVRDGSRTRSVMLRAASHADVTIHRVVVAAARQFVQQGLALPLPDALGPDQLPRLGVERRADDLPALAVDGLDEDLLDGADDVAIRLHLYWGLSRYRRQNSSQEMCSFLDDPSTMPSSPKTCCSIIRPCVLPPSGVS
jgi:hypothetical protein